MSLATELFGVEIRTATLEEMKAKIRSLPPIWSERKSYLLHDFARIAGVKVTHQDFLDIGALPQKK